MKNKDLELVEVVFQVKALCETVLQPVIGT